VSEGVEADLLESLVFEFVGDEFSLFLEALKPDPASMLCCCVNATT